MERTKIECENDREKQIVKEDRKTQHEQLEKFERTRTYQAACIYVRLNRHNFPDFRL